MPFFDFDPAHNIRLLSQLMPLQTCAPNTLLCISNCSKPAIVLKDDQWTASKPIQNPRTAPRLLPVPDSFRSWSGRLP